jgi:hypothetical protein
VNGPARRGALLALAALLLAACKFDMWIEPPPEPPPEPPMPAPFQGEQAPPLVATSIEGVLAAPSVDAHLYYSSAERLWYRYAKGQWYQAFRWNGHWFPPENVPAELRAGPPDLR